MAKSRMINTKIWEDGWFNDLDPIEKLFFVYLLTNPMTNILGAYELSKGTMGRATGLESRVIDEMLSRFEKAKKVYFRDGWVVVSNFIKHQNYRSPKILAGLNAEMKNVPNNIRIFINLPGELRGIDTLSHLIKSNSNSNTNADGQSPSVKFSFEDMELASHLLDMILKNTPTFRRPDLSKWAEQVRLMRERDNRTSDQIRLLIDWSQASNFWQANILSTRKLREKFDTLVAQIKRDVNKETVKKSNVAFA